MIIFIHALLYINIITCLYHIMPIISLQEPENIHEYKKQFSKILIQFSAGWCGPCTRITPLINNKFNLLNNNQNLLLYVDIDKHQGLRNFFKIETVPTFHIYDRDSDSVEPALQSSDIVTLTKYCINNGIPLTESSY